MYTHELSTMAGVWRSVAGTRLGVVYVATADHRTADGAVWDGVVVESSGECAVAVVVVGMGGEWRERGIDVVRTPPADM